MQCTWHTASLAKPVGTSRPKSVALRGDPSHAIVSARPGKSNGVAAPAVGFKSPGGFRWHTRAQAAQGSFPPGATPGAAAPIDARYNGLKVLVAGSTGGIGRNVVDVLQELGVPVRALARDTAAAESKLKSSAGVEVIKGDVYQYNTLPKALEGCNAVIVATGASDFRDPFGPYNVDYQGTLNLISAAKRAKVKKFVLVTSIGADDPYNFLNLFWGVLFWKKQAEAELQRSGLSYTIVRPGGLKNELGSGEAKGNIVMEGPNTFGVPPVRQAGSILRRQVAEVCCAALVEPAAAEQVVEIIAQPAAPAASMAELFRKVAGK